MHHHPIPCHFALSCLCDDHDDHDDGNEHESDVYHERERRVVVKKRWASMILDDDTEGRSMERSDAEEREEKKSIPPSSAPTPACSRTSAPRSGPSLSLSLSSRPRRRNHEDR